MRRVLAVLLGVFLLILPAATFAQDDQPKLVWDLSNTFTAKGLGFQFNYPAGWVIEPASMSIAENDADMALILDGDPATQPAGYSISLGGVPLEAAGATESSTLEEIADKVAQASKLTEDDDRVIEPVMSLRSLSIIGTDANNRSGVITLWKQNGNLIIMSLQGPELTEEIGATWGAILELIQPADTLALGDNPVMGPSGEYSISYPADWFSDATKGAMAEIEADLTSGTAPTGILVAMVERPLSTMGTDVTDLAGVLAAQEAQMGWSQTDPLVPVDHIILEQPALTVSGPSTMAPGSWLIITVSLLDKNNALVIGTFLPSEEAYKTFAPTYLAMLKNIKFVEAS